MSVLVNGKIEGEAPYAASKIVFLVLGIVAALLLIHFLVVTQVLPSIGQLPHQSRLFKSTAAPARQDPVRSLLTGQKTAHFGE